MNRIFRICTLLISMQLVPVLSIADQNQYLFDQANKLYQQENYEQAIEKYLEIQNSGYESWQLYYNLGNSYYKTRQFGRAILNFERALKLNPKNEDIQFNLELANLSVVDKIISPPQFITTTLFSDLKKLWGIQTLTFLALGFYLILALIIIMKIISRRRAVQRILNLVLVPAVIVFLLIALTFVTRVNDSSTSRYAIILADKIDVLSSPGAQATELFSLHEGLKFKVEEIRDDWAKIRLADGKVGWVRKDFFEII
ncbi:MAG TPA: tetratricopeptide repeat protein [bacterium]